VIILNSFLISTSKKKPDSVVNSFARKGDSVNVYDSELDLSKSDLQLFPQFRGLLDAIRIKESGHLGDGLGAVGDNGKALGPYQIWEVYWIDAVEKDPSLGENNVYGDVKFDKDYSEKIIFAYWSRYATEERIGRGVTDEDRARIHNGGPNGYKKDSTISYWNSVKSIIESS
jgi:hypothetical protein